jgi:hypothetical protein
VGGVGRGTEQRPAVERRDSTSREEDQQSSFVFWDGDGSSLFSSSRFAWNMSQDGRNDEEKEQSES